LGDIFVDTLLAVPIHTERGFYDDHLAFRGDNKPVVEDYTFEIIIVQ
jgi:hypothetical protein